MGFKSLGACSKKIILLSGLGGPLKVTDPSALGTPDAHDKAGHPGSLVPARTADGANDLITLQVDPGDYPPATGT